MLQIKLLVFVSRSTVPSDILEECEKFEHVYLCFYYLRMTLHSSPKL